MIPGTGLATSTSLLESNRSQSDLDTNAQTCRFPLSTGIELSGLCWPKPNSTLPPVVLVHGLASNAYMWMGVGNELQRRGHHVIALNLRGHYHSSKPTTGYDFATVSADITEVITSAQLTGAILVGQSWGANLALEFAAAHPTLISALVCVDGGFIRLSSQFDSWQQCKEQLTPPSVESVPHQDLAQYFEQLFRDWPQETRGAPIKCYERLEDGTARPWLPLDRHQQILKSMWLHDPTETAPKVRTPTILIAAHDEPVFVANNAKEQRVRELLDLLPCARAYSFHQAHHDIHAQYPILVANLVASLPQGLKRKTTLTRVSL